jgi:hypothetical protein
MCLACSTLPYMFTTIALKPYFYLNNVVWFVLSLIYIYNKHVCVTLKIWINIAFEDYGGFNFQRDRA